MSEVSLLSRLPSRLSLALPVLLYLSLVLSLVLKDHSAGYSFEYVADSAYADAALASRLVGEQFHGLVEGEPVPALRDTLWRGALAVGVVLGGDPRTAALLTATLAGLLILVLSHTWAKRIHPDPTYLLLSTVMVVVSPGFVSDAVSGSSRSLATLLVMVACFLQIHAARARKTVLPLSPILPIALAAWLRIEYVLVWPVLCLQGVFLARVMDTYDPSGPKMAVRMVLGGLGIAALLLPILALNWWILQVPWPREVGVPLSADMWWLSPREALRSYLSAVRTGMVKAQDALLGAGLFQGGGGRWLTWLGILTLGIFAFYRGQVRPFLIVLFLPVFLPLFYALLGPHVGWKAAPHLFNSLSPLFALTAMLCLVSWPPLLEPFLARKWALNKVHKTTRVLAVGSGIVFVLYGLSMTIRGLRERSRALLAHDVAREAINITIETTPPTGSTVVTDEPGWLAYRHGIAGIDLSGEFSPAILQLVGTDGRLPGDRLNELLRSTRPYLFILWNRAYEPLVPVGAITPAAWSPSQMAEDQSPLVRQVRWPGGS